MVAWCLALATAIAFFGEFYRRRRQALRLERHLETNRLALKRFSEETFAHHTVLDIVLELRRKLESRLEIETCLWLYPEEGGFEYSRLDTNAAQALDASFQPLMAWLRHNRDLIYRRDLRLKKFGAYRTPLRQMFTSLDFDTLMPIVWAERLIGVLGIRAGQRVSCAKRSLLRSLQFRMTAACTNVRSQRESDELAALAEEVDLAASIELAMVPETFDGDTKSFRWSGYYRSAERAGSDFWGVYPQEDGCVVVIVGDSVGRGLAGAMVSAVLKSCCDTLFDGKDEKLAPSRILTILNQILARKTQPALSSCFVALLDPSKNEVCYANAGHPMPYCLSADGSSMSGFRGSAPMLGHVERFVFVDRVAKYAPEDRLFLFTNGIPNSRDADNCELGYPRMQGILRKHCSDSAKAVKDSLVAVLEHRRSGAPLRDDEAFIVFECR